MNAKSRRHPQIIGIDLLRLLAATLVMLYHFGFWHWTAGQMILPNSFREGLPGGTVFHFGWVGVEIFFVISGVVIAYSAEDVSAARFARSRLLRLAPGAWVCATVSFILFAAVLHQFGPRLLIDFICTLLFWPFKAVDAVYWTLGMEIAFYTLVFFMIRAGRLARLEPLMIAIGLAGGVFWIAALVLAEQLKHSTGLLATLNYLVLKAEGNRILQLLLVQHGCLFGFGVVLQRASVAGITRGRVLALAALTVACLLEIDGQDTIIERAAGVTLSPLPAMAAWLAAMALLVGAIAWNDRLLDALGRYADLIRFGGRITYPLYLIHNTIVFSTVVILGPSLGIDSIAAGIVLAFVAAALIERFPERLVRRALSKLISYPADRPNRSTRAAMIEPNVSPPGLPALDGGVYVHAATARTPR